MVRLDRDQLAVDEKMLAELFGLLVIAHYQTSASDLRQLLDDPDVSVYAAITKENHIAATALVVEEGGLDAEFGDQIRQGTRRLKGHLSAQTLSAHLGLGDVVELSCRRIMRVAVHPDLRLRGLGTVLLEKVTADAQSDGMDYLATSFGVTTGLLKFWQQVDFSVVKIGTRRNAASANYSGLLLCALSPAGQRMFEQARRRFAQIFPQLLQEDLASLDAGISIALAKALPGIPLTAKDRQALAEFANTDRSYVATLPELTRLAHLALFSGDEKNLAHGLLIMKLLQNQSWTEMAEKRQLTGKSQAVAQLREAVKRSL
jgi:tRNA(Met) cytidine acetyltransferase